MKPEKIRVLFVPAGKSAEVLEISNTLEAQQKLVSGLIEPVTMYEYDDGSEVTLWVNEEGLLNGLPVNISSPEGRTFVGDCYVSKTDADGESVGLNDAEVEWAMGIFQVPLVRCVEFSGSPEEV